MACYNSDREKKEVQQTIAEEQGGSYMRRFILWLHVVRCARIGVFTWWQVAVAFSLGVLMAIGMGLNNGAWSTIFAVGIAIVGLVIVLWWSHNLNREKVSGEDENV